jgi:hypothetical protein
MLITTKAVMIVFVVGIGLAAGVLLEPHLTRPPQSPVSPAALLERLSPAGKATPPDIYQQATQGNARVRGLFLDNLLLALNTFGKPGAVNGEYLDDFAAVYATLAVLLQDDSELVAEPAAAIINVLALMERTTDIEPVSESATIKRALASVIANSTHDTVRGRAIDAWVMLYPPDDAMIATFEKVLQGDMTRFPESHAAAFRAYGIYKRRYDYPLPETAMATAKQLLEHPSQDVRVKAEYALAEMAGPSVLPTLIARLKQAGNSSEGLMLTALILRLDNSQDTIDTLNRIAAASK